MSPRNMEVLAFIKQFMKSHRFAPSYAEIGRGVGLRSPASVHRHVLSLASSGVLDVNWRSKRGIALRHRALEMDRADDMQGALRELLQVVDAGHGSMCGVPECTFCAAVARARLLVR